MRYPAPEPIRGDVAWCEQHATLDPGSAPGEYRYIVRPGVTVRAVFDGFSWAWFAEFDRRGGPAVVAPNTSVRVALESLAYGMRDEAQRIIRTSRELETLAQGARAVGAL